MKTPLQRAEAKREQLERELRKCPDFQLYLLTKSRRGRERMESVLMEIPQFALWRTLTWRRGALALGDARIASADGGPERRHLR